MGLIIIIMGWICCLFPIQVIQTTQPDINATQCLRYNKSVAQEDIKNSRAKIILIGGIVPVLKPSDTLFKHKFSIGYYDTGCVSDDLECIKAYNNEIFVFLDKKFGKRWRKFIRKDVVGLGKFHPSK